MKEKETVVMKKKKRRKKKGEKKKKKKKNILDIYITSFLMEFTIFCCLPAFPHI